ncbi:hypothetical protein EMPS_03390 [Entomortierella parvispora]|uniref:C2H2-type domain-containing protein n=1 Tax=Entomortierella parvispora TaxID=205924 RepID=A0A9P3H6I1_9FUNG|nr:hypothetical protein EMPS_03390 [Entomortierella parvispora]
MQTTPNTFNPAFFFIDKSSPTFFAPSKLDSIQPQAASTLKPPIFPIFPISTTSTFNPPSDNQHVHHQRVPSPTLRPEVGYHGSTTPSNGPVSSFPSPSLLSLEQLGWINSTDSSLDAPFDSASASASARTALPKSDASGFDHLSPFDEACASAFDSPFSPFLDTPDQTPSQTPLFECVASDDFDAASLEQFWSTTEAASASTSPATFLGAGMGENECADAFAPAAQDSFSTLFPSPSNSILSTSDAEIRADSFGQTANDARLQAETALLDFVLFDDIAPMSPISTLSTPMSTTLTLSPSTDSNELETQELAMQLVAAAAASMNSQSLSVSAQSSPMMMNGTSNYIGSLFDDVNVSPLMDTPAPTVVSSDSQFSLDWTSTVPQTYSFDFSASALAPTTFDGRLGFGMSASPMMPLAKAASSADLDLLMSLLGHQQQYQTSSTSESAVTAATKTSSENPLKRKSDVIKEAGEEAPRQFTCAQCGRAFSRLFNLNTHERTHDRSKARLFACPEQGCKKSFTRKNDLQRHQISIHGVTHIYACQKCDKPFSRKDELRRHSDLKSCQDDDPKHEHA